MRLLYAQTLTQEVGTNMVVFLAASNVIENVVSSEREISFTHILYDLNEWRYMAAGLVPRLRRYLPLMNITLSVIFFLPFEPNCPLTGHFIIFDINNHQPH